MTPNRNTDVPEIPFDVRVEPDTHYVVDDCDTRSTTVGYFTGGQWYLIGSARAFSPAEFAKRFNLVNPVEMEPHAYSPWKVESGRFA
jgi:hypothetical protein